MNVLTALRPSRPAHTSPEFAADVVAGLSSKPKRLPPKYFYDSVGAALFERITQLPEYYLTRCELKLLREQAPAMAALFPPGCALIEFGGGSSRKARILLGAAADIDAYVPVDICDDVVPDAMQLRRDLRHLKVHPVVADFTKAFAVPAAVAALPRAGFFPGSTIGNFEPRDAAEFLRHAAAMLGKGSVFIIGVDLVKDRQILHSAYNDAAGVTAQFNFNVLVRINRELGGDFDLGGFEHQARYDAEKSRIEMHLVSTRRQTVRVAGARAEFRPGESIHTESSYKYTIDSFNALAHGSGWSPLETWTDGLFGVFALRAR